VMNCPARPSSAAAVPGRACNRMGTCRSLQYAGSVLYGGCVKRHERVNAFNVVWHNVLFRPWYDGGDYDDNDDNNDNNNPTVLYSSVVPFHVGSKWPHSRDLCWTKPLWNSVANLDERTTSHWSDGYQYLLHD